MRSGLCNQASTSSGSGHLRTMPPGLAGSVCTVQLGLQPSDIRHKYRDSTSATGCLGSLEDKNFGSSGLEGLNRCGVSTYEVLRVTAGPVNYATVIPDDTWGLWY